MYPCSGYSFSGCCTCCCHGQVWLHSHAPNNKFPSTIFGDCLRLAPIWCRSLWWWEPPYLLLQPTYPQGTWFYRGACDFFASLLQRLFRWCCWQRCRSCCRQVSNRLYHHSLQPQQCFWGILWPYPSFDGPFWFRPLPPWNALSLCFLLPLPILQTVALSLPKFCRFAVFQCRSPVTQTSNCPMCACKDGAYSTPLFHPHIRRFRLLHDSQLRQGIFWIWGFLLVCSGLALPPRCWFIVEYLRHGRSNPSFNLG